MRRLYVDPNTFQLELEYDRVQPPPRPLEHESLILVMDDRSSDGGHRFKVLPVASDPTAVLSIGDCYGEGFCPHLRQFPDGKLLLATIVQTKTDVRVVRNLILDQKIIWTSRESYLFAKDDVPFVFREGIRPRSCA